MENNSTKIKISFFIFVGLFTAILIKAFMLQVVDKEHLLTKAKKQFFRERTTYPKRGSIYDRNGNPLAINVQTYSIFTIPKNLKGDYSTYREVSKIVPDLTYNKIMSIIKKRKKFTFLARKIELTNEQVEKLKDLKGVHIEAVAKRFYPNHELVAQTVGFVGIDNGGLSGIEYAFDEQLKGKPKITKYVIDRKGRPIKFESTQAGSGAKDIILSIDKDLQSIGEKALKDAIEEYGALKGGFGVMNSETGEILAMGNYPTFDPNYPHKSPSKNQKLSFITDPFEPGSTFKSLTIASALEHKIARPDTNYYCEQGKLKVEGHIISEAESKKKYEWLSVTDILSHSSNVGTTKIAFDLTYPKLKETLKKFRIGEKTGIEISGESRGIFNEEENVSPLSLSNISFGQGVATTGIQMLSAYSAILNEGNYIKPTILKRDKSEIKEEDKERIIEFQTSRELKKMLVEAVENGTGTNARIPYFTIGGKTSTAQKSDSNGGGYTGYTPGFIGFPLGTKDKFVVYVYVHRPEKGKAYYGGVVAAPVFKKIAQYILYKDRNLGNLAVKKNFDKKNNFDTVKVKHSSTRIIKGHIPDFKGLDKRSASQLAKKLNLTIHHQGIGVVSSQDPPSGEKIEGGRSVRLYYNPPSYE
ncbi:penicillin-binding protein [Halobacteriovorax sp. HLS]|uniref:penicillin-binding protein n=1 Tax=Halobacteriovorax sp. HLS TaxID=2234000 RepID=UPI000FD9EE28|nr:penicillin-binding protein [Halobacteriovorax sp. HLS]